MVMKLLLPVVAKTAGDPEHPEQAEEEAPAVRPFDALRIVLCPAHFLDRVCMARV